jgi:hypothetical protein
MLTEVKKEIYQNLIPEEIYSNPAFVKATAQKFEFKYYIYFEKEIPLIGFLVYLNHKNITSTNLFTVYNGFWINERLKEKKINQILVESLDFLKSRFRNIKFILPIGFNDVRAFKWCGFDVEIRYTYIKNLKDLSFKSDVNRNYNKALKEFNLLFFEGFLEKSLWGNYQTQLNKIGFSKHKIAAIFNWLLQLEKAQLLKIFIVKESDIYAGSAIVLLDEGKKNAFLLYNHTISDHAQSQKTAFLYVEIHHWLLKHDFNSLDYLGANFRKIAEFKSNFNPTLNSYFIVNYNVKRDYLRFYKNKIKALIKNLIKR